MKYTLLLTLSGCLASSQAVLVCDGLQTTTSAANGFPDYREESNPVLGKHPDALAVATWFIFASIAILAADSVLSPTARRVFHVVVTTAETAAVIHNWPQSGGWCVIR